MYREAVLISSTLVATLALAGSAGAATVGPSSHDYGGQAVGTSSAPISYGLTTTPTICTPDPILMVCVTDTEFTVNTVELGGGPGTTVTSADYTTHNISCPYPSMTSFPLANGVPSFCQFEASFAPTAAGVRSRTLSFPEGGGPTATLNLTGTGLAPPTTATTTAPAQKKKCKKGFKLKKVHGKKKCVKKKRR